MDKSEILAQYDLLVIAFAIVAGTAARIAVLKADSRQVPSVPTGYFIHLVNGFVAAGLGAVAIPALLAKDFAAVTFLALAIQHFREIRKQQKESLEFVERTEYAPRGEAYIDGIAKSFEARNYIALLTALGAVLITRLIHPQGVAALAMVAAASGAALAGIMIYCTKGKRIGDICDVHTADFEVKGASLYVDGIFVSSMLGTPNSQALFAKEGVAFVVKPRSPKHRLAIGSEGQRQAMLFDAVRSFGLKKHSFTRRSLPDGRVVIAFEPIDSNREGIASVIQRTPILESVRMRNKF